MAGLVLSCSRSEHALELPFANAHGSWQRRTTLDVELRAAGDAGGRGEASPLPGYSPDALEGCERALGQLSASSLEELGSCATAAEVFEKVAALVPRSLPAARFALETAALDRLGQSSGRPLWSLLRGSTFAGSQGASPASRALCAVLPSDDPAGALHTAKQRFAAGVRAFKLKVGPHTLTPAQEQTLEALRSALGGAVELRLDANRSFARESLGATCERLTPYAPAFIEEPLERPHPSELAALSCGFALDESLSGASVESVHSFLELPSCRALVLKPTLLGGFSHCLELARLASAASRGTIVSHALEGPLGFAACVQLALALSPGAAHGLWPLAHQLRAPDSRMLSDGRLAALDQPGLGVSP